MPENLEIKTKISNPASTVQIAESLGATDKGDLMHVDTYFNVRFGRLKLREINSEEFELIFYNRDERSPQRLSHFDIYPVHSPQMLMQILSSSLGILGRVEKTRKLFQYNLTRIHLDTVAQLGTFLEFETAVSESTKAAKKELTMLMKIFNVSQEDCFLHSYIDLIAGR